MATDYNHLESFKKPRFHLSPITSKFPRMRTGSQPYLKSLGNSKAVSGERFMGKAASLSAMRPPRSAHFHIFPGAINTG